MKLKSVEIKEKRAQLKERALNIINNAKQEVRDLTENEDSEIDLIKKEIFELDNQMEELQDRLEKLTFDDDEMEEEKTVEDNVEEEKIESKVDEKPIEEEKPIEGEKPIEEEKPIEDEKPVECEKSTEEEKKEEKRNNDNFKKSNIREMDKNFSLVKAIRSIANHQELDAVSKAVVNEGAKEMRNAGLSFGGQIQLPLESRAITVATEHDDIITTDFADILEPLRAKNVLVGAGAKFITNLTGDLQIPIMNASNVGWEDEIGEAKDGGATFDSVKLSPRRLSAFIDVSKTVLSQDSLGIENMIREDLVKAINSKLEETILGAGAGDAKTPAGIFSVVVPTSVSDYKGLVEKEATVEDANVMGECKYILSNKAKAALRSMAKSTKSTQLVYENGEVDGTEALSTSLIEGKKYIYGDFSNLVIGQWGAIDLTIDPYTKAASGQVRIVVNAFFDAKVVRPTAFATGNLGE